MVKYGQFGSCYITGENKSSSVSTHKLSISSKCGIDIMRTSQYMMKSSKTQFCAGLTQVTIVLSSRVQWSWHMHKTLCHRIFLQPLSLTFFILTSSYILNFVEDDIMTPLGSPLFETENCISGIRRKKYRKRKR